MIFFTGVYNMKKKIRILILLLAASLVFAGCGGEFNMELSTGALVSSLESGKTSSFKMAVQIHSMDETYAYDFIREKIPSFSNPRYVGEDGSKCLEFDVLVPVVSEKKHKVDAGDGNLLYIIASDKGSEYGFSLQYNKSLIDALNAIADEQYSFTANLDDFAILIAVTNNRKSECRVKGFSCYIEGAVPSPFESEEVPLAPGEKLVIKMSEVFCGAMAKGSAYKAFSIAK